MSGQRPPVIIRFRFNKETGRIEELTVDDSSPLAPESYHDEVARALARRLELGAEVVDAFLADAAAEELEDEDGEGSPCAARQTESTEQGTS